MPRRRTVDKVLRDKTFNIAKNPKYDGYQKVLASMVYRFFGKNAIVGAVKHETIQNKELAKELQKPIIRKFEKRKVHSSFIFNIWGADLADMKLLSKFINRIYFLLWVIDIYSKNNLDYSFER